MTEQQISGAEVFFGNGGCVGCHQGAAFSSPVGATSDQVFFAVGFNDLDINNDIIGEVPDGVRLGRGGFSGDSLDNYKFKVPSVVQPCRYQCVWSRRFVLVCTRGSRVQEQCSCPERSINQPVDYRFSPLGSD